MNVQGQGGEGALTRQRGDCFTPPLPTRSTAGRSRLRDRYRQPGEGVGERPFTFLTPLIGDVFGGSLTLTASATAPILNPADATILRGT